MIPSTSAMPRAKLLDGNKKDADDNLSSARKYAEQVADVENRKLLMSDLGELTWVTSEPNQRISRGCNSAGAA